MVDIVNVVIFIETVTYFIDKWSSALTLHCFSALGFTMVFKIVTFLHSHNLQFHRNSFWLKSVEFIKLNFYWISSKSETSKIQKVALHIGQVACFLNHVSRSLWSCLLANLLISKISLISAICQIVIFTICQDKKRTTSVDRSNLCSYSRDVHLYSFYWFSRRVWSPYKRNMNRGFVQMNI